MMNKQLQPDYKNWGITGTIKLINEPVSEKTIQLATNALTNFFGMSALVLKNAHHVYYYQGPDFDERKLVFLRFEKNNGASVLLNDEHISLLFDEATNSIFGYMNLINDLSNVGCIGHQRALTYATAFLQKVIPELVPLNTKIPTIKEKAKEGSKITFNHSTKLGNLALHWIGKHDETILSGNKIITVCGMKVKLYDASTNLWIWVVINKNGDVIAFENDVFWNFEKGKRETQLWLHDKWLIAHETGF